MPKYTNNRQSRPWRIQNNGLQHHPDLTSANFVKEFMPLTSLTRKFFLFPPSPPVVASASASASATVFNPFLYSMDCKNKAVIINELSKSKDFR
ncbi:hypothetical protein SDJN03_04116, partial [Cucurbita argyrosperma subsp. sororia]